MNCKKSKSRLLTLLLIAVCTQQTIFAQINPPSDKDIFLADPAMFFNKGVYYLYGTAGNGANKGFPLYTSKDMITWQQPMATDSGYALKKGNAFGNGGFWAPQVFAIKDSFYMAYVADEEIAIAKSISPAGPFVQTNKVALGAPVKQIDPFVFIDDDGKIYLYHVRLTKGNKIFVAEMAADLSAIKPSTLKECITATDQWENTANTDWPVTEGPAILKRNNLYYLFYTANDFRNADYAVGYATSKSPYGPWIKYAGNPIISKNTLGMNGTGHGDFIIDDNRQLKYVFHTHFSETKVSPRRTALIDVKFMQDKKTGIDKLEADKKTFRLLTAE